MISILYFEETCLRPLSAHIHHPIVLTQLDQLNIANVTDTSRRTISGRVRKCLSGDLINLIIYQMINFLQYLNLCSQLGRASFGFLCEC